MTKDDLIIIAKLKELSILKCLRRFTSVNESSIPAELRDQEADADTFLIFSDGSTCGFYASAENFSFSIQLLNSSDIPPGTTDVSANRFWNSFINRKITDVTLLYQTHKEPYGIHFHIENHPGFSIQYASETEHDFDALIIRKE